MSARVEAQVTALTSYGEFENTYEYYYSSAKKIKSHHVVILLIIVGLVLLFHFRHKIAAAHDRYRTRTRLRYSRLSGRESNGFEDDLEEGLSSNNFDIQSNIASNDTRKGLLEEAKQEIRVIMNDQGLSFDEARLSYLQQKLDKNGIDKNGMPLDPKTVTFS